jgi:hypothetical protein
MIDHALKHNTGLQNSNRGIDDMISSGSSILTGLRDQRNVLKVSLKASHLNLRQFLAIFVHFHTSVKYIPKFASIMLPGSSFELL